jgi:hypothetical protein
MNVSQARTPGFAMATTAFAMLLLAGLFLPTPVRAQAAASPAATLAPELEAKLAEFIKKARAAKQTVWESQIKKTIARVSEVTGSHPEMRDLEAFARQAMELSLGDWTKKATEGYREWALRMPEPQPGIFDQMMAQVEQSVQTDWFGDYVRPFEQPKWTEGLRAALTAEQFSAWEKTEQQRRLDVQKELGGAFQATLERRKTQLRTSFEKKGAAIWSALILPKERALNFNALADSVATTATEKWRARAERALLWMDDEQRRANLKGGNFYIRPDANETKASEAAWEQGVAKLLTPEEAVRLRTAQNEYKERRIAALALVVITQFDEAVAFTAEQRERLRPIAERVAGAAPSLLPQTEEGYYQISVHSLLSCGRSVTDEELKTLLDSTQRARWKKAYSGQGVSRTTRVVPARALPQVDPLAPTRAPEPEDLENALSDHLHEQALAERKRLLAFHLLKAEDATRIAGLAAPVAARLATAARGSAEEELAVWKGNTDQTIRSQLRDVTVENLKLRIAGLDRFGVVRRTSSGGELGALWEATVKAELTEPQRAAWEKELDARAAYRDKAIASLVMAEFDRRVALTEDQWRRLEPRVAAMLKEYAPDIASMFSYSAGYVWYLASHSMFIPIAAVPESEMKALLTKEQWERWSGAPEFGNMNNYWENIQRRHTNRVRVKQE